MTSMWETGTPLIDADDATGFYGRDTPDSQTSIWYVQWNKARTARYGSLVTPGHVNDRPTGDVHTKIMLDYEGQAPLRDLTVGDQLPVAQVFRFFVAHGPWDRCMFCNYRITERLPRTVGVSVDCARKRLGVTRKFLEVVARHQPPPGPGRGIAPPAPPADASRNLYLVAVDGRRVA